MRHVRKTVTWALALVASLLLLAFLTGDSWHGGDGNALASDSQPGIAISGRGDSGAGPQQALPCAGQLLPVPWVIPTGDSDCDGFSTTLESIHLNTLPFCAAGAGDGWPADLNNDDFSDISDISALGASFGKSIFGGAPVRHDIAPEAVGDGVVDISDIVQMGAFFGRSVAAYLPAC